MILCTPISVHGDVGHSWGRAPRVAVAHVDSGAITSWQLLDVGWDSLHDEGSEGSHHARVARFLRDNKVDVVVASHMGAPMANMIGKLGIRLVLGADGDARVAVLAAA